MANKLYYDLIDLIGEISTNNIIIGNLTPNQMNEAELEVLIELIKRIKGRKEKPITDNLMLRNIYNLMPEINFNNTKICGLYIQELDKSELECVLDLVKNIKIRNKEYKIVNNRWDLKGDYIYVTFDYHPYIVKQMWTVPTSKWSKEDKANIVHISDWPLVEQIFRISQANIEFAYQEWKKENKTIKLRVNNQGCYLTGLDLPFEDIHMVTSFPDPNAKHNKAYKDGHWDGRIALYDKATGFFPYGLLPKVVKVLRDYNIDYERIDERVKPTRQHNFELNVNLRDYQKETIEKAIRSGRGVIQLATGAGKTKTASAMVSIYGVNTIFFVHTKFLLTQAKEALEEVLNTPVGQVGAGIIDIQPVTVAMVQTTIRALGEDYTPSEDDTDGNPDDLIDDTDITGKEEFILQMLKTSHLIFFDECQFVAAETFYTIANYCPAFCKFGLSATPYRSDKKDLMIEAALGPVIHKINASYLIKRGFLTQPKIHFFSIGNRGNKEKRNYQQIYREEIVENEVRNRTIVKSTTTLNQKNRSVLILVQQVTHGKILQEMFAQQGINVEFVYGNDDLEKREFEVKKLRHKKALALIASTIADEGLDVPTLDAVILAGGGKSPCKSMQRVGRSIRVFKEKEESFEIYNTICELKEKGNNALIVVEDENRGKNIYQFCLDKGIDVPYIKGTDFLRSKNRLLKSFSQKEIPFIIVNHEDLPEDEINKIAPLDSILIVGTKDTNISKYQRIPSNIEVVQLSEDPIQKLNRLNEIQNGSMILVDSSKFGNILKKELQEIGFKVKFISGNKQVELIDDEIKNINNSNKVLIINSNYLDKAYPFHLVDHILVIGDNSKPFKSISKIEKDMRIFTIKDEAFVIDFCDNSKYLLDHSYERKLMYKTEDEFILSGWK